VKADNPLTQTFLSRYPAEAARILEHISPHHVALLLNELPAINRAGLMTMMLPEKLAACLLTLTPEKSALLFVDLPVSAAARVYRNFPASTRQSLSSLLSKDFVKRIQQFVRYPAHSAGALSVTAIDILPRDITVSEALRRLEHPGRALNCELYVIDAMHHLEGSIELGKLITSKQNARLHEIMTRKTVAINALVRADTLLTHAGWKTRRRLPVVDRTNILLGALDYADLEDAVGKITYADAHDPVENLFSFAGLFWHVMAELLESVLNISRTQKGERT